MKVVPPRDWSQCPECGVPMDYVEPVYNPHDTATADVVASPCGHSFEVPVG